MKYFIEKGKHSCTPRIHKVWYGKKAHSFAFTFNRTMWHKENEIEHQGINKICGVSFGIHAEDPFGKWKLTRGLVNSIVIGWRPNFINKDTFELYIISDSNGIETRTKYFNDIKIGQECKVLVSKINKKQVNVNINGTGILVNLNALNFGYYLGFYFGGHSEAPWNMYANLTIL